MLNKIALSLIDRKTGRFFNLPTDQDIASLAKINKELTFHVARHTFDIQKLRQHGIYGA